MALINAGRGESEPEPEPKDPKGPREEPTILLELALYQHYRMNDVNYDKGIPYRFRTIEALQLLGVTDFSRPVWRLYQPPAQSRKKTPAELIKDATEVRLPEQVEPIHGVDSSTRRIDVGTDDEIADILNRPDDAGNVTV
jgi:hypothetical protein